MARQYYQGLFIPTNPKKYVGDINKIIFRSNWEKKFMIFCDTNVSVIKWNSEEIIIPYFNDLDNKTHKYYPDFLIQIQQSDNIKTLLIEIKPERQTKPPTGKKQTKRLITENITYNTNLAKWSSAKAWCHERNIEFKILTEKDLDI